MVVDVGRNGWVWVVWLVLVGAAALGCLRWEFAIFFVEFKGGGGDGPAEKNLGGLEFRNGGAASTSSSVEWGFFRLQLPCINGTYSSFAKPDTHSKDEISV